MYFTLLDIVRFLSAVSVFFHHTFIFHYGKLGVYLFFIISGFVIYFSLGKGIKEYIVGRFLRLFPLFWVCCTITYLVTVIYGNNLPIERYFISMLMFNDGKIASMVDGSYWTLTFELLFYFYIGVFVWLFSKKRLEWFYILWLGISFACFYFKVDQFIVAKLLSIRFAPYFVFGGMLALFVDTYKTASLGKKIIYIGTMFASPLVAIYVSNSLRAQQGAISNFTASFEPDEMLIVLSFFIFIPLLVYLSYFSFAKQEKFTKICFILGGITYPLYLLHWKIGNTIISNHGYMYGRINLFSIGIAALIFVVSYYLSIFELPIRKYLKQKFFSNN